MMELRPLTISLLAASLTLAACQPQSSSDHAATSQPEAMAKNSASEALTAESAAAFVEDAEQRLAKLLHHAERVLWVYQTYINQDTEQLAATADEEFTTLSTQLATEASRYRDVEVDPELRRKLDLLSRAIVLPAPEDAAKGSELAGIVAKLGGMYGKGEYCPEPGTCWSLGEMERIMAESRDADEQLQAWNGWRTVSPPMRDLYARQVELTNQGAKELGFNDLSELWRSWYDMQPNEFSTELDRLWGQVKPLYDALHCHVRAELNEHYGDDVVPLNSPIPAHLLGNMWAQSWGNIYDIAGPEASTPAYDLTQLLVNNDYDAIGMVKAGENFFSSLGFAPLPETFWERSQFTKPQDRDVVCHASAWDVDGQDDIRIKMCIETTDEMFQTIHHELGHNYYQRAYKEKSYLFQNSANDGFHEAVGDTIALSITPEYLEQIGLLSQVPDPSADIGLLMRLALDKVAFLPFGLMVDQWRWKVFQGEAGPEGYNDLWWSLREQYQGIAPPNDRPADAFDPGAKYHVPGNTPYSRYFLAHILQFQFHRSLCEIAGNEGPIHRCSIYGSEEAGRRLNAMLEMGQSKPWPDALEALTGSRQMDATAILDYFAPLKTWLDEQNQGRQCGW
jgi:peptidyl-dipeptidase A